MKWSLVCEAIYLTISYSDTIETSEGFRDIETGFISYTCSCSCHLGITLPVLVTPLYRSTVYIDMLATSQNENPEILSIPHHRIKSRTPIPAMSTRPNRRAAQDTRHVKVTRAFIRPLLCFPFSYSNPCDVTKWEL